MIKKFKKNQELIKKQINFFIKGDKKINKNNLTNLKLLISGLKEIRNYLKVKWNLFKNKKIKDLWKYIAKFVKVNYQNII